MNKKCYCDKCDLEFTHTINGSLNELKNIKCPNCHNIITNNIKRQNSVNNKKIDKTINNIFNIWYYIHFILSIIGIIFFFLDIKLILIIISILNIVIHFIESLIGLNRNYFGTIGIVICSILGIYFTKDILIGICIGSCFLFLASSIIQFIINFIFNFLYKKLN